MHSSLRVALSAATLLSAVTAYAASQSGAAGSVPPAGKATAPEAAAKGAVTEPPPPPQPIPQEQIFRAAEELGATLRKAEAAREVDPAVEDVERRLAAMQGERHLWADLGPQQIGEASAREIERLRQTLGREEQALADAQAIIEERTALLADLSGELQRLLASWQLTGEVVLREKAPPAVLQQVKVATDQLRTAEQNVRAQRNRLLELQGRVSELRAAVARAAAVIEQAEVAKERQIFEAKSAPLWRALAGASGVGSLGGQFREAMRETRLDVGTFLGEAKGQLGIHLVVVVALALGLLALRRPVAAMEAGDQAVRGAVQVLARPWSAAFLISLALVGWIYPPLPPAVKDLALVAILVPLLRLLPSLVPELFRRPLVELAALFALDKFSALAPPQTSLARLALMLVTVATLAILVRGVWRGGWARSLPGGAWGLATRGAVAAAFGLLLSSLISNVAGNVTLAERLTHATLASATLGALLLGMQAVLEACLAVLLHLPLLQRRRLFAHHRHWLQQRTSALLRIASAALWAWRTAVAFAIDDALGSAGAAFLAFRLHVGGLDVTLGNLVAFGVTLGLAVALSRAIRFVLDEGVFPELELPQGSAASLSKIAQYIVLVLGFSWAMLASGIEMSRFSFLVGALGVGVGFGLQNIVNNFVSGLILLFERPIQVGDAVEVGAVSGVVTQIGVRSSRVRTGLGAEVIVPNATLISAEVTNWSGDPRRRIDLTVGVAYDAPPQKVIDLLLDSVRGRAGVLESPAPLALLIRFGDSSIQFALQFWTGDPGSSGALASQVMIELLANLGRAGIQIPFPQRDLHLKSLDPTAAKALGAPTNGGGRPAPAAPLGQASGDDHATSVRTAVP
jgi:potassium-dependent mechanosensitive channel